VKPVKVMDVFVHEDTSHMTASVPTNAMMFEQASHDVAPEGYVLDG
jgi:hypothetical protein